jgi:hypothetical protein
LHVPTHIVDLSSASGNRPTEKVGERQCTIFAEAISIAGAANYMSRPAAARGSAMVVEQVEPVGSEIYIGAPRNATIAPDFPPPNLAEACKSTSSERDK